MDLTPFVEAVRRDLAQAAAASDAPVREAAERLALAAEPSARLALLECLSAAAAEITASLRSASVEARLRGREVDFVVSDIAPDLTPPIPAPPIPAPPGAAPADGPPDGGLARISLRLPEAIKLRAEALAEAEGLSLNTWLVQVVRRASESAASHDSPAWAGAAAAAEGTRRRMTGWV